LRAVAGEKTAFAYSDDISEASLETPRAPCAASAAGAPEPARQTRHASQDRRQPDALSADRSDRHARQRTEVALLEKIEQMARARDPRIVQVMAGVAAEYDVVLVARADGTRAADVRPLVRLSDHRHREHNGRREIGSAAAADASPGATSRTSSLRLYVESGG